MDKPIGVIALEKAVSLNCSDIHFTTGQPIRVRLHGDIIPFPSQIFSDEHAKEFLNAVLDDKLRMTLDTKGEVDFPYTLEGTSRFRGNAYKDKEGYGLSFRVIPSVIPKMEDLNLPPVLQKLCHREKGLILVTGPTGSGKSTTLASMIQYMNKTMQKKIITLEDPIEFQYKYDKANIVQRQIGVHTESFYNGLRASLRQDPDVILLGEMRDLETIATAITAGETGHLVFGTLHTTDARSAVERIIDMFPPSQQGQIRSQLAMNLVAIVAQRLLKTKDGKGRVGAFEVLLGTKASKNLIREQKVHQLESVMQSSRKEGMITMQESLQELLEQDIITNEEASKHYELYE